MTAFHALADTLDALAVVIRPLTTEEFSRRDVNVSGSVGAHVRHCLDHVTAFEHGIVMGEICYDHRIRNTCVEQDPQLALSRLRRASTRVALLDDSLLARPLTLLAQIGPKVSIRVPTSVGRELAFVTAHTIHHSAIIALLLEHAGHDVPARFGRASTTPAYTERSCAQ
jgi:uncharacterized damage-inducible protein DinB